MGGLGPCDGPPLLWLNLQFFAIVIISVGRIFEQARQTEVRTLGGMLGDQNFGHVADLVLMLSVQPLPTPLFRQLPDQRTF